MRVEEGVVVTTAKQCMTRLLPLTPPTDHTHPCQCCALQGRAQGSVTECTHNPPHRSSSRDSRHRTLTLGGDEGGSSATSPLGRGQVQLFAGAGWLVLTWWVVRDLFRKKRKGGGVGKGNRARLDQLLPFLWHFVSVIPWEVPVTLERLS